MYDAEMRPQNTQVPKITKQLGIRTVWIAMTLACILIGIYRHYGTGITVGCSAIFAFLSFHYCLCSDEAEQFAFAFVGFLCLGVVVLLLAFGPSDLAYR